MNPTATRIQEKLTQTVNQMSDRLNGDMNTCFEHNMENPEGFSECITKKMHTYEDFAKRIELFNLFGIRFTEKARTRKEDESASFERLGGILENSIDSLTKNMNN